MRMGMKIVRHHLGRYTVQSSRSVQLFEGDTRTKARNFIKKETATGGFGAAWQAWSARPRVLPTTEQTVQRYRATLPL